MGKACERHRHGSARVSARDRTLRGSDLNLVTARDSLYLEPEASYPFVPGHEVVGELEDADSAVVDAEGLPLGRGDRVAVWPILGCRARGLAACDSCIAGWDGLCEQREQGWPGRGVAIGFNRRTGGGWAEACLVWGYGGIHGGTYDRVIDAAGTAPSLRWSLAAVRPRGHVVLATSAPSLRGVDPTPIWYREITYPLASYVVAFETLTRRREQAAVKVAFRPIALPT